MYDIVIKELWFKYEGEKEWTLKNINLKVRKGEKVLITGPSGCGKTTLCRCIIGLIPHFYRGEYKGEVLLFNGNIKVSQTEVSKIAQHVGMVFQDPESQLIMTTVEREIAFGLENLALPPSEIRRRVEEVLLELGISNLRSKHPYQLSGGEQQKVALASILAMKPKILILDEPTANLDPKSTQDLLQIVSKVAKQNNITIVIVEHKIEDIFYHVDRIVVLNEGRIEMDVARTEAYKHVSKLEEIGVEVPIQIKVASILAKKGYIKLARKVLEDEKVLLEVVENAFTKISSRNRKLVV